MEYALRIAPEQMKRLLLTLIMFGLAACALQPAQVSGDAWSYRLLPEDLPAGWALSGQDLYTASDFAAVAPITGTTGLTNALQLYSARYRPPQNSQFADFTLDIIVYASTAEAQAALKVEALGDEWEQVEAALLGDESRVWHFRNPAEATNQNLYRVDFRYLNAIGSVSLFGAAEVLPNPDEAVSHARKVLAKMQAAPQPKALEKLQAAQLPDARALMLTPAQLKAALSDGVDWSLNNLLLPGWVNNEDFPNAEAQKTLNELGRVTGYQMWLVKPPVEGQATLDPAVGLFQQVSVYQPAANTAAGLKAMVGLPGTDELKDSPAIGEGARMWSALVPQDPNNRQTAFIATSEISFRAGRYLASVQLQSQPINDVTSLTVLRQNHDLAIVVAEALAKNLESAKP
jgi:hypothetical protein